MDPQDSGKVNYLPIIGVVRNFNFESLRNPVSPYIFKFQNDGMFWGYITVRLTCQKLCKDNKRDREPSGKILWKIIQCSTIFLIRILKRCIYRKSRNAQMAVIFSILAILIASLGLFGLTSFTVEQRTKEIGVRKAMGSSVAGIYVEISKEIVTLVSVSALIAWPIIYYIADKWLENFYYRINLGVFSFIGRYVNCSGNCHTDNQLP